MNNELLILIKSIERNCHSQEIKLSDILRQCKSLGYKLNYIPLKTWVNYELIGYPEDIELPQYRIIDNVPLFGDLIGNHFGNIVTIKKTPIEVDPRILKEHIEILHRFPFRNNVANLQSMIDSANNQVLRFPLPQSILPYLETGYSDTSLVIAYRIISVNLIAGILDTIKTRILDFTLEIQALQLDLEYDNSNTIDSIFKEFILKSPNIYYINTIHSVGSMNQNPGNFSVGGSVSGNVNNVQGDNNRAVQGDNNQAVLGDNNQVTQQNQVGADTGESLTKEDVVKLLAQLETLIQGAELPADTKEEVIEDLSAAKKATDKEEPNKQRALERLGTVAETLEKTSKGVEAGQKIWTTAKPIIVKVATWLGVAAGSHLLGL